MRKMRERARDEKKKLRETRKNEKGAWGAYVLDQYYREKCKGILVW